MGNNIQIMVTRINGNIAGIGIEAPADVPIVRGPTRKGPVKRAKRGTAAGGYDRYRREDDLDEVVVRIDGAGPIVGDNR